MEKYTTLFMIIPIIIFTIFHLNPQKSKKEKGDRLYKQGKYEEAYKYYIDSNVDPRRLQECKNWVIVIKLKRAKNAEEMRDYEKAFKIYEECERKDDCERVKKLINKTFIGF